VNLYFYPSDTVLGIFVGCDCTCSCRRRNCWARRKRWNWSVVQKQLPLSARSLSCRSCNIGDSPKLSPSTTALNHTRCRLTP